LHSIKKIFKLPGMAMKALFVVYGNALADESADARQAANGLWLTAEHDAVVEFAPCKESDGALCGVIVWDQDARLGGPQANCGVRIAKLDKFGDGAWRDGWAFDPRTGKRYKTLLRVKADEAMLRSYVGIELLGETENLRRVDKLPAGCTAAHSN
jgi:uncharacterized protein (DUF2147 family)